MSITVSLDYYKQAHMQQSSLSSMALGVMTSTVFQLCDLNTMNNFLVKFCNEWLNAAREIKETAMTIEVLKKQFERDYAGLFDRQVKQKNADELRPKLEQLQKEVQVTCDQLMLKLS